ncbi:DUF3558 family protein [Actinokineospora sp.]|uniref:DUF3558 family protein n=1 Tax=Actinokineospora sp. TaxID=1872133 RepID=UPI00403796FA
MTPTTIAIARRAAITATVVMISVGLAACGDTAAPGTPVPVTTTTGSNSETATSTAASSTSAKSESLADTNPCDLLTNTDKATLGVTKVSGPERFGTGRICRLRTPEGGVDPGIRTDVGLAGIVVDGAISDVTIGSHQAKQMRTTTGGCFVFIGVTASSRVDVLGSDRQGDQDEACDLALRAAKLIEPNLPES